MRLHSTIRVAVMAFVAIVVCSGLFAQGVSFNSTSSPEQLLHKFMSLDGIKFDKFAEHAKTNAEIVVQLDRMLEHLNQLDEEQLLGFVKTGFDNGWPIHVVGGMFDRALTGVWDKKPMDANRVCAQITDKAVHPGCKLFIIMRAQRTWSQQWSDGDVIRFNEGVADYASDTNICFRLRVTAVDEFLQCAKKHLSNNPSEEKKVRFRSAVRKFVMSALENAKSDETAKYALVRDSLRGYEVMQIGIGNGTEPTNAVLTNIVYFLMNTNSSVDTVRQILEAQAVLNLSSMLKPEDVRLLKEDRRFAKSEDNELLQELLQRLSESIAKRKRP